MNHTLLKMAGFATLVMGLNMSGFAQSSGGGSNVQAYGYKYSDNDTTPEKTHSFDEIIVRHKGDKDAKVTLEIKNGEIFINGKPASEYKDEDLTISKRRFKTLYSDGDMAFSDGDGAMMISPFRNNSGGWSYDGRPRKASSPVAFLGVTTIKEENGPAGAKVGEVSENSPAEKAGLKEGDLITKIDENTIDDPNDLTKTIRGHKPGDKVTITYKRDGKEQKATVELGKGNTTSYSYGLSDGSKWKMDNGTEELLRQFNSPRAFAMPKGSYNFDFGDKSTRLGIRAQDTEDGKGVKVVDVDEETAAAKAGVMEGDIITRFDGQEVNTASKLAELARAAREDKTKTSVKINLIRAGKPIEVTVKVPRKLRTADL
jgi:serine protease Do